ncbi:hypothetical protein Q428_07630 [Fervidicella metallireducens AeB]|uniref:GGDEF domain-containing protein n=1 Tax=Fervidicella metallireducens AeB TaxID=1403537 RepID=A0A017RXB5_9CLOT|nr:diguanylate cyclase [Fervidicella metallireducens]EYE88540.1 hypothetical protein Q428_07630 [Fervidicella metallireducens AeB]
MSKNSYEGLVDKMTGLKKYECFVKDFESMIGESLDKCEDLSLSMVDIDNFMRVNEEYGYDVGDEVIISIAEHLKNNVDAKASIYRYAGDQFAILMPSTEKEKAFLIMEKIRETYSFNKETLNGKVNVTISAGISCFPHDGNRITEVIRKAEGALYRAKAGERNRVCLSREEKMVTKTSHYTYEQLKRLSELAKREGVGEAVLLREALDDLLKKYDY